MSTLLGKCAFRREQLECIVCNCTKPQPSQLHPRRNPSPPSPPSPANPRYYLSGNDAFRLKLQLPLSEREIERRRQEKNAIMGWTDDMVVEEQQQEGGGEDDQTFGGLDGLPPDTEGLIA